MIRHIDPVSPATAPEPNSDRPRDGQRAAPRHDHGAPPDATTVQLSAPALARRPGRPRVPPPDTWAGAMIDLVLDAATGVSEVIRRNPGQAASAQANSTAERAWELMSS